MGKNYSEVMEILPTSSEKESRGGIVSTMANSSPSSCSSEEDGTPIRPVFCLKSKSVTDIKRIEEIEDCFILEFDPFESIDLSSLSVNCNASETDADGANDLSVIAEKGQVACRDYPHSRHLCLRFPFDTTAHENFCELCYCYVCDSAAPCKYWTEPTPAHCHASENVEDWEHKRNFRKQLSAVYK